MQLADKMNLTWIDLQATLLTYESCMEKLSQPSNLTIQPVANSVPQKEDNKTYGSNSDSGRGNWQR